MTIVFDEENDYLEPDDDDWTFIFPDEYEFMFLDRPTWYDDGWEPSN